MGQSGPVGEVWEGGFGGAHRDLSQAAATVGAKIRQICQQSAG